MGVHSIFGTSPPGGTWHQMSAGTSRTMWMGSPFRLTSGYASLSVPTATVIGGRFYLPPSASISGSIPTYATVRCWAHPQKTKSIGYTDSVTHNMKQLAAFPVAEVRVDNLVFGGWNEGYFDPPVRMPIVGKHIAIAVAFPGAPGLYGYWDTSHNTPDGDHMAADGYPLAWPENILTGGDTFESYAHGWRVYGELPGPVDGFSLQGETSNARAGWGIDILVKDDIDTGEQELYVAGGGALRLANLKGAVNGPGTTEGIKMLGVWDGSAVQQLRAVNPSLAGLAASTTPVRFTTTGSTFTPYLTLRDHEGTTVVHWVCEENAGFNKTDTVDPSTGAYTPTFTFGSAATRHLRMYVDDGAGHSRMNVVETLNLGYDDTVDTADRSSIGSVFNKASESVTLVENLNSLSGLLHFMADNTQVGGTLDCTGMGLLRFLSVYTTPVSAINLTGCVSLKRLVVERCHLTTLDLNPVKDTLEDLRAANQYSPADGDVGSYHIPGLTFTTLTAPMTRLWHYCVRGQRLTNSLDGDNLAGALPVAVQIWDWSTPKGDGTARTGTYKPDSPYANWLVSWGNAWTALDLSNQIHLDQLDFHSNSLASINLTGAAMWTGTVDFHDNLFPAAEVNKILAFCVASGRTGQTLNLGGTGNAAPTGTGVTDKATLASRGWSVTTN